MRSPLFLVSLLFLWLIPFSAAGAQWLPVNAVKNVEQLPDGAEISLETGFLRLQVCADDIIHVVYSMERAVPHRSDFIIVHGSWPRTEFALQTSDPKSITLVTAPSGL